MRRLSDISIGKKLVLVLGGSFVCVAVLIAVGSWAALSIDAARKESGRVSHMMTLAEKVSANEGGIAQRVATMTLEREVSPAIMEQLLALRKEYLADFAEIKSLTKTEEGSRLLDRAEAAATQWREADNRVMALLQAHKPAEAAALHRAEVVSSFNKIGETIGDYLAYREKRLQSIDEESAAVISRFAVLLIAAGCVSLAMAVGFGVLLTRNIARPLGAAIAHLKEVAGGDLMRDAPAGFLARGDEIGLLANAKQAMIVNLRQMVQEVSDGIRVLSSSSAELSANSGQMSSGSREASAKAHAVAAAAEQMTANVTSVAAGMEQTATNLTNVSSNTEQMTATIGEIAANSERARRITEDATHQAARISEQMNQLGVAAREIGKVTETITEISSQTNLLALNATIEAARAGSAGKGFAVVANEIKELAQQTARATEDIKARIEGVQSSTTGGIAEIEKVSKVIHDVSEIVSSIAAAIEEQATATKDIARNIAEATTGVKDANKRVAEASLATRDIAREIVVVDQAAGHIATGSEHVRTSATDLSRVAEQLQVTVARFHISKANQEMLLTAVSAHEAWNARLKSAIDTGKLDVPVNTVRTDDHCQFGKWLHGSQLSAAEKQTAQFRRVKQLHAQFHEEAAKVAQFAILREKQSAEKAMSPSSEYARVVGIGHRPEAME